MTTDSSNPPEKPDADDKGHGVAVVQKSSGVSEEGPPKTDGRQTDLVPSETTENAAQSTKEGTGIPGSSAQPAPGEKLDEPGAAKDGMQLDTAPIPDQHLSDDLGSSDNLSAPFMPFFPSATDTQEVNLDLLPQIPRLFRLLDLVSDKSIEKILIDHKSMGAVMNVLREGSYKTISKIDFAALDGVSIKPVGLYGSKSALVDFLLNLQVVDESIAKQLGQPIDRDGQLSPYLRSGIYLLLPSTQSADTQFPSLSVIHLIYWPEDETWNDDASPTIQKNRTTFMRYLTKLAQDIRPLISDDHASAFVWKYDNLDNKSSDSDASSSDDESDDDDRFVRFDVKEEGQQAEGVEQYPGFTYIHPLLGSHVPEGATISLVPSETSQAFVVSRKHEAGFHEMKFDETVTSNWFRAELNKHPNIYLRDKIGQDTIQILFEHGALNRAASVLYSGYKKRKKEDEPRFIKRKEETLSGLHAQWSILRRHVESFVGQRFSASYNTLDAIQAQPMTENEDPLGYLIQLTAGVPKASAALERRINKEVPFMIDSEEFKSLREKFIDVAKALHESTTITEEEAQNLVDSITARSRDGHGRASTNDGGYLARFAGATLSFVSSATSIVMRRGGPGTTNNQSRFSRSSSFGRDDVEFLRALDSERYKSQPAYEDAVRVIKGAATVWVERQRQATSDDLFNSLKNHLEAFETQKLLVAYSEEEFLVFLVELRQLLTPQSSQSQGILIESVQPISSAVGRPKYLARGSIFSDTPPYIEYSMSLLQCKRDDMEKLEEDPSHVPSLAVRLPAINRSTPQNWKVLYVQLLDQGRRVLHIIESPEWVDIYLNESRDPQLRKSRKRFATRKDRALFFAADEQARLLVIVYVDQQRFFIQKYAIDEYFDSLQPRGPQIEFTHCYEDGLPVIQDVCFFNGGDGVCLLETSGKIRVFSLETKKFWPGAIQLSSAPAMMQSSPDGSALLLVERSRERDGWILRVYHQATFSQKPDGIAIELPVEFDEVTGSSFTVSSLGQKKHVFLIGHISSTSRLVSIALRISCSESHWHFRRKQTRSVNTQGLNTKHNSLVDCFSEVWERFPIVPAISREFTATQHSLSLTFVQSSEQSGFGRVPRYFTSMIQEFTNRSPKPTGVRLSNIEVRVLPATAVQWDISDLQPCRAGEWFVELICLIPIHIAVARENRFLPYKDGISGEYIQEQLMRCEVADMIDVITLGPYEAILGSYMATRPIKVVSSMGEQSVGKSFSLNHLVDTSFAGSAMRTTEGVWLSLCPTKDQVVVALDFEGVHSLERTAQEDMLLVLFNAAISNLIMFRNNFALNRNVANMFTSFQDSASLFNPENNPNLFKGLLTIIIKDVMDADRKEIVEEFRSKFKQIVDEQQGKNFITVLHDNQLAVMPWDVIRSKEFFTRFSKLSKHLFKQKATHANAGEFLLTLKTLMAKITARDWGAIDQTLIRHRTSLLLSALEGALSLGYGDLGSFGEREELKNYDTQQILEAQDTDVAFYLGMDDNICRERLAVLLARLGPDPARSNLDEVVADLENLATQRIEHVKLWVESNVARFMPTNNSDIDLLQRKVDELSTVLLSNIQFCRTTCTSCQLRCLLPKAHNSAEHDCGTSHRCTDSCSFCPFGERSDVKLCGMQAGHDGDHICEAAAHVCGEPCRLKGRRGCQETCIRPIGHSEDEHTCAANLHQCGQPCKLQNIGLRGGQSFSCPNVCVLPCDTSHETHSCGEDRSCPVRCELCPRFCSMGDHFHGLRPEAVHLCEQDHPCHEICQSLGVCQIEPKSESVETVYRGLYDSFSYMKCTQIARRLQCGIRIPQGRRSHQGLHMHTTDPNFEHYCDTPCPQCGYICHLPYGHKQKEHDTAHGSMQNTIWAVEGSVGSTIETDGHTFGAQDSGAPQLCFMYCKHLGRHAHVEVCPNGADFCQEREREHARERILPEPDVPKDWISHRLFWAQTGFKDPYNRPEFALCDHRCAGQEHESSTGSWAGPSYCTLPIFHPPALNLPTTDPSQHVSRDHHHFKCPDPATLIPAFHIIFLLDRSSSMWSTDNQPLQDRQVSRRIASRHNNRYGAVLSAFYQLLDDRRTATTGGFRRDAYSVVTFNHSAEIKITHDTTSSIDQLLDTLLEVPPTGGTDFEEALITARQVMEQSWSAERSPVVIFLSDGEGSSEDGTMTSLCDRAITLGKALSFWSISFGPYSQVLQEFANIAKNAATRTARASGGVPVPCDFRTAINTVQLTNEFSNIATSLRKTRAALINPMAPAYTPSGSSGVGLLAL